MAVGRKAQRVDVIYVTPRHAEGKSEGVFHTPDGEGRYYYDTVEQAKEDTGLTKVVHLDAEPSDY